MTLYLTKEQTTLVHLALESYHSLIKVESRDSAGRVKELVEPNIFQIELLLVWFERQREMSGE